MLICLFWRSGISGSSFSPRDMAAQIFLWQSRRNWLFLEFNSMNSLLILDLFRYKFEFRRDHVTITCFTSRTQLWNVINILGQSLHVPRYQIIVNYLQRQKCLLIETLLERTNLSFTTFQDFDREKITSSKLSGKLMLIMPSEMEVAPPVHLLKK